MAWKGAGISHATAFALIALVLVAPYGLSGCSWLWPSPEQRIADSIWRDGNEFVRVEHQRTINGARPAPNFHPVRIPRQHILNALEVLSVKESANAPPEPLFSTHSLAVLSEHLEKGLATARPDQDVTFAVEEWHPGFLGFLGFKSPKVVSGRVFYSGGWLNLVFGSVLRDGTRRKAMVVDDLEINPYTPGMRSGGVRQEWILWVPPGSGVFTAPGVGRGDWLMFAPQALAPGGPPAVQGGVPGYPGRR